jgi:phage/plasmid-associated DNA primase
MEYTSEYRNDNDGIARFFTEKISSYEEDEEKIPITASQLKSTFKQWKVQNEQISLNIGDMDKRVIELYGKCPKGGWMNFKILD